MIDKNDKLYYQVARAGSKDLKTPVMRELLRQIEGKKRILDLGCGDGTRLATLVKGKGAVGIDDNEFAIKEGKKRYPQLNLIKGDIEKLPFSDEEFNFVYSAFVLEHLREPEKALKEAIRVLVKKGTLFLAAPNYGAPNRRSPCSVENKYLKLVRGVINDFLNFTERGDTLGWTKVIPREDEEYEIDFDTTVEPYILSLIKFLKGKQLKIIKTSTFWEIKEKDKTLLFRLIIRYLGQKGIFPFEFWGPQLLVVTEKVFSK